MVLVTDSGEVKSADQTFTTGSFADAIRIPQDVAGPPYTLDQDGALYVLTEDISAPGTTIVVAGRDVTLELDGHAVTFGTAASTELIRGIHVMGGGTATIRNGHLVQGDAAIDYSAGIESRSRAAPLEVLGITTDVHRPNGYPVRLYGAAANTGSIPIISRARSPRSRPGVG